MNFKKFTAVLTAFCFLTVFTGQSFAGDIAAAQSNNISGPGALSQSLIIPERFGKITESANYNSPQVIVIIQDLHAHAQVQKNIASILQSLDEKYAVKKIYSEGASGKVDISWLSSGENSGLKQSIVLQMIENGTLTGAEYFAFLNGKNNLFGMEDAKVHRQNIVRLGNIYENEAQNLAVAAKVKNEINYLAGKNLSEEMKKFSRSGTQYHGDKMEAAKYYGILLDYAEKINADPQNYYNTFIVDPAEFTELQKVVLIDDLSKKLNSKRVNLQLQKYLSSLKDNMPFSEYRSLLGATNNFSDADTLCKYISERGLDGKVYPQLQTFLKIKELNSQVNPLNLFAQEQKLEEQIRKSLASSGQEREISFLKAFCSVFEGYLTNKLTAKDDEYFKRNIDSFKDIYGKYAPVNHLNTIADQFAFFNDYYGTNNKRNEIFIQKINENDNLVSGAGLSALSPEEILKNAEEIIVIVAGGYHTAGINDILSAKKISRITITPKISESAAMAEINYRQIITDQSRIFKNALAPSIDIPRPADFAAAAIMHIGKDKNFNNIDEVISNFKQLFSGNFKIVKDESINNVAISFENGDSVNIARGENNEILISERRRDQSVEATQTNELAEPESEILKGYIDFGFALIRLGIVNLASVTVTDFENEILYKAAKKYFTILAVNGIDMGVNGAIPAAEEYAKTQVKDNLTLEEVKAQLFIDGIAYELFSRMPEVFQEAVLQRQRNNDLSPKDVTTKKGSALKKVRQALKSILIIAFTLSILRAAYPPPAKAAQPAYTPQGIEQTMPRLPPANLTNAQIRKVAETFMQGNPLPRSFLGDISNITYKPEQQSEIIFDKRQQEIIVSRGASVYDTAVLMQALLLYPYENRDLIEKIFDALRLNRVSNTTNKNFIYGDNDKNNSLIPAGEGYYWKILSIHGRWLQDQSQPITGENAWIGNTFVSMAQAYKGSILGDRAYQRAVQLAKAVIALQTESGGIRMAPEDTVNNYTYKGLEDNYYQLVSLENNVSAYSFLKNLHDFTDNAKLKNEIAAALSKLENFIFSMYDEQKGYFLCGIDLKTGLKNEKFATDCQTWTILPFGAKNFNIKMKERFNIDNASVKLLKRTLDLSGVKENGKYIGLDFTDRARYVSFEWTLGWQTAVKEALVYSNDAELRNAVNGIDAYIKLNKDSSGILKYMNTDSFIDAYSWIALPLPSLAATSWSIFNADLSGKAEPAVTPFDVVGAKTPGKPSKMQTTQQGRETPIKISEVQTDGDGNWRSYWFDLGANVKEKDIILTVVTVNAAPKSLAGIEIRNLNENGVPITSSNIILQKTYPLADEHGATTITIPYKLFSALDMDKPIQIVVSTGKMFNGKPLNPQGEAAIEIPEVSVKSAPLKLPFSSGMLNGIGIFLSGIMSRKSAPLNVSVRVNMIYASSNNLAALQRSFGESPAVDADGNVSQNVFIMNQRMSDEELTEGYLRFSSINSEPIYVKQTSFGIVYYAESIAFEDIAAKIQDSEEAREFLKQANERLVYKATLDYVEVDAVSEKKDSDVSKSGNLRLYVGNEIKNMPSDAAAYFERARADRNAKGWQKAKSIKIFADTVKDIESLGQYMKIFPKSGNGNIIFTKQFVDTISESDKDKNKFKEILERLRKAGAELLAEKNTESEISEEMLSLFDGRFDSDTQEIEITRSLRKGEKEKLPVDKTIKKEDVESFEDIEKEVIGAKHNVVIYASAIEQCTENDNGLGGKFLEDLLSIKIIKYFRDAPITADSARETARYYDMGKIMSTFKNVDDNLLWEMYGLFNNGASAEDILRVAGADNFAGDYLNAIDKKIQDESERAAIKMAFIEGFLEKLAAAAAAAEFKRRGGERFESKETEKLVGQVAALKYIFPLSADTDTDRVNEIKSEIGAEMNESNYRNKISAMVKKYPGDEPAVADAVLYMIFLYERKGNFSETNYRMNIDLKTIDAILKAA